MDTMKEFKDQSVEELKAMFHDLSKSIFEMKNEISTTRKIDKPHLLRKKKRDRARILTLLNRKGDKV
ncbi:MAG: 50S ribosomal protein L29 [Simkaniaceae bacterium]|nr:50S ribosomal protein L29 [Candidatus Sacchlamyda saccharinae]